MKHDHLIIDSGGKIRRNLSLPNRAQLAAAMAAPICRNLNYHDLARKVLQIQPLPQGALPTYDGNIDVASIAIGSGFKHNRLRINSDGKLYDTNRLRAHRVIFPTFDIVSSPTIRIDDVRKRRFSLIDCFQFPKGLRINSNGKSLLRK